MSDRTKNEDVCNVCNKSEVENRNVEGKKINLCGKCSVDYFLWRSKYSPVEPDVESFVLSKKYGYPFGRTYPS